MLINHKILIFVILFVVTISCRTEIAYKKSFNELELPQKVLALYQPYKDKWSEVPDISPFRAYSLFKEKRAIFIDVREHFEQKVSFIPGAIRIKPKSDIASYENKLDSTKIIIVYCTIGDRSGRTTNQLKQRGYTVFNLAAGIIGWTYVHGPLITPSLKRTNKVHAYNHEYAVAADGYINIIE